MGPIVIYLFLINIYGLRSIFFFSLDWTISQLILFIAECPFFTHQIEATFDKNGKKPVLKIASQINAYDMLLRLEVI